MNRRELLRMLAMGVVGHTLEIDKLLWVPGAKTIFIPDIKRLTNAQIVALEMQRLYDSGKIKTLFERDDKFYKALFNPDGGDLGRMVTSSRVMRVPMRFEGEPIKFEVEDE